MATDAKRRNSAGGLDMKRYTWFFILLAVLIFNMVYWQLLSAIATWRPEGITRSDASIIAALYLIAVCMYMNSRDDV